MQEDKRESGVFAPEYYMDFKCIADKCRHSCCVDWEICIDRETYGKYRELSDIFATVTDDGEDARFKLCEDGRCPHLNKDGLCNIIISHGEEYLSEICRNHPRFFNCINDSKTEAGLGVVCEEACRLILENEKPFLLCKVDELYSEEKHAKRAFDAITPRNRIIAVIEAEGGFDEKIARLKAEFNLPRIHSPQVYIKRFLSLEILEEEWERDLKAMQGRELAGNKTLPKFGKYYERLLIYFVYRHVSIAKNEKNLRARLAFCILSVETIRLLFEENLPDNFVLNEKVPPAELIDYARRYSAEIEYSEDNADELIFAFECEMM